MAHADHRHRRHLPAQDHVQEADTSIGASRGVLIGMARSCYEVPRGAPYGATEARRLLAQAGFPNGFDVTIGHTLLQAVLIHAIVADLGRIGIRATARQFQWEELMARMLDGRTEIALLARSCSTGDAGDFLTTTAHSPSPSLGLGRENYAQFRNTQVDWLIEEAERELDRGNRLLLLQASRRRTLEPLPYLPLLERSMFLGVSDRVEIVGRYDQWMWVAAFR